MAKLKTLYPLKGIFTNLLEDVDKDSFLIPAYQRGYKWVTNLAKSGQVDKLLTDLYNAYQRKSARYYLQFLTLKETGRELEVIDGQQRLTTLTILFSVIGYHLKLDSENVATGKLRYRVRENFVQKYIYDDIKMVIDSAGWEDFKKSHKDHDNQDVYFIYHAAKAVHEFISDKGDRTEAFFDYICKKAFLIVNLLGPEINSEKVFINVNKGIKLNDEDLVKGLLITKIPIDTLERQNAPTTEIEINELRSNLGRQWDETVQWASRRDVMDFFRVQSSTSYIEWLIRMTYRQIGRQGENPLFNYVDQVYNDKRLAATDIFDKVRETKLLLNDWFYDPEIANLMGYVLHANGGSDKDAIWQKLQGISSRAMILSTLKESVLQLLPLDNEKEGNLLIELNYKDHKDELFNVFLMLDVCKFVPLNGRRAALYDFRKISSEQWSLEHIFPQNIKDFKSLSILSKEDLQIIRELLPGNPTELKVGQEGRYGLVNDLYRKLIEAQDSYVISGEDKEVLSELLSLNAGHLHRIGNMALLQTRVNSGLSNHFFDTKRKMIAQRVSEGKFVPFHTYDVFSKLVIQTKAGLHIWSMKDIEEHENYISLRITECLNYLTSR